MMDAPRQKKRRIERRKQKVSPLSSLRALRVAKGYTQKGLAGISGVSRKHILQIEKGNVDPSLGTLSRLATALEVQTRDLIDESLFSGKSLTESVGPRCYLPVVQNIVAGDPLKTLQGKAPYLEILTRQYAPNRYILRVRSESMRPQFQRGDLILIENGAEQMNGDIIACTVNKDKMLRRYEKKDEVTILLADNLRQDLIVVTRKDKFTIHGVVQELLSRKYK